VQVQVTLWLTDSRHGASSLTRRGFCQLLGESLNSVQNNLFKIFSIYQICIYIKYKSSCQFRLCKFLSWSRNSLSFMEPKYLLLCSQQLATRTYHKPDEPNPYRSTLFLEVPFHIIFPSTSRSPTRSPPFRFYDKNVVCIFRLSRACYMAHLSYNLDFMNLNYFVMDKNYEAPHYANFCSPFINVVTWEHWYCWQILWCDKVYFCNFTVITNFM
jgi:hypothetical protein